MSKIIKPSWSNILLSQQNEKQVSSTTGSVRLCSVFLNLSFHCDFTLKHNNSLSSIIGYTFSILCRLPALLVIVSYYEASRKCCSCFQTKWPHQEKTDTESQIPHLKTHFTDSTTVTQTKASVAGNGKIFSHPFTQSQKCPVVQRNDQNISPVVSAPLWAAGIKTTFSHLTAHPAEALQVHLTARNKAKKNICFIFQILWLLPIRGCIEKTTKSQQLVERFHTHIVADAEVQVSASQFVHPKQCKSQCSKSHA